MDSPPLEVWERDVAFSVYGGLRRDLSHADSAELWVRLSSLTARQRAIIYTCIAVAATESLGGSSEVS